MRVGEQSCKIMPKAIFCGYVTSHHQSLNVMQSRDRNVTQMIIIIMIIQNKKDMKQTGQSGRWK